MATIVMRFKWKGIDLGAVQSQVSPSLTAVAVDPVPTPLIDVGLDGPIITTHDEQDLIDAMTVEGWSWVETAPVVPLYGLTPLLEQAEHLSGDHLTNTGAWEDLLSFNGIFPESFATVLVSASSRANLGAVNFRVLLDGVPIEGSGMGHDVGLGSNALVRRVQCPVGAHEFKLQWRSVGVGASAGIDVATSPDDQHASLVVFFYDK